MMSSKDVEEFKERVMHWQKNFEGRRSSHLNLDQSAESLAKTFPNLLEI